MKYGIMQGRLLDTFKSQYQAHPILNWEEEFIIAQEKGLHCIEFIVDAYLYSFNPILTSDGIERIRNLTTRTNVRVNSICADIFMHWPLKDLLSKESEFYKKILEDLIYNLSCLGGTDIVIPFVDNSSLKTNEDKDIVIRFLNSFQNICEERKINLSLETDLAPQDFYIFLEKFENSRVKVNYDSGNSASLGYKFEDEMNLYGNKISNIHIKDRSFKGGPKSLGDGDAELSKVKQFINNGHYSGLVIFQAFRDDKPIETFDKQFSYFKNL